MRRLAGFAAFALVLAFVAGAAVIYAIEQYRAPGPSQEEKVLVIPRGAGLDAIARLLESEGVISGAWLFKLGVRIDGASRDLKAGEYAFGPGVSMAAAAALLSSGKTLLHPLTIPEGLTSAEVAALVNAQVLLEGDPVEAPPEGSLLPNTYHFSRGEPRTVLLERMTQAMAAAVAELWPQRAEGLPLRTTEEAVTLASIIEKETGVPEERGLVAGVFVNRLKKGMRLQSDPTVVYGLTKGKAPLGRLLTRADLKADSPYNTYQIVGLPPGPIANPGFASLQAALTPEETEYLYFVADGTGGHAFARSLAEHNRNVAKWRKLQK